MSVIALNQVQTKARDLIAAHAFFLGETVVADDGKQNMNQEDALKARGHMVTVLPILDGVTVGIATGSAIMKVSLAIEFAVNPEIATKNIYDLVTKGIEAVLNYGLQNKPDRFELDHGRSLVITTDDAGVWSYTVFFNKSCVFNRS